MSSVRLFIEKDLKKQNRLTKNGPATAAAGEEDEMETAVQKMINSCRLCLDTQQSTYLFTEVYDHTTYCDIAMELIHLTIKKDDSYPKHICMNCASLLTLFDSFKRKSKDAYLKLCSVIPLSYSVKEEVMFQTEESNEVKPRSISSPGEYILPEHDQASTYSDANASEDDAFKPIIKSENVKKAETTIVAKEDAKKNSNKKRRKQTPPKKIQCEKCGQVFLHQSLYSKHCGLHSTFKQFECDICKQRFTRKSHVGTHMMIHNNIKPYACQICGHAFRKANNLQRHMAIHSTAFNFSCDLCGKLFKRYTDLQKHKKSHTGIRPYKCRRCDKTYASLSGFKKHMRKECFAGVEDLSRSNIDLIMKQYENKFTKEEQHLN